MKWLNGLKITPERLMDNRADETITSGLSVPSGWTVSSFTGVRVHGITEVDIFVTRTGTDITESSAGSGNLTGDPLMCTLPSGWAPPRTLNEAWGNGAADGEASIATNGEVTLRSISGSAGITTGSNVRITAMWISETPSGYVADETTDITTFAQAGLFWVTGAAGDGTSDDRWAIQTQLDAAHAAGGGTVIIPAGKTYGVSTFLVVYDNTTVWAYGATIKAIGNTGLLRNFLSSETFAAYGGHSHIQILGGIWDANAADAGVGTVTATTNCMGFIHCEDITVRDATITNVSSAHGVEFNSTAGARVLNCRFLGYKDNSGDGSRDFSEAVQIDMAVAGSAAIGLFDDTPSKNIRVEGCYVGPSSRLGSFGRGFGSHMLKSGVYYYGIQIIGNRIESPRQQGVYGFGWRRAVIANNVVSGSGLSGIQLSRPDPVEAGFTVNGRNISITGNTIEGAKTASGIRVFGSSGGTYDQVTITGNSILGGAPDTSNGIHVEYCSRPAVTGNSIGGTQSTGIVCFSSDGANIGSNTVRTAGSHGVNVTGSAGVNVHGNTVDGATSNGIYVTTSQRFAVQGNWISDAAAAGIRLHDGAQDGTVNNNRVIKGTTGTNGITVSATTAADNVVANNDLTGSGWAVGTALIFSTAAITAYTGGTTSPGANLVS